MRLGIVSLPPLLLLALLLGTLPVAAAPAATSPDFKEVYDLIREHLSDVSEAELNRIAVHGLISGLGPKVSLVEDAATEPDKEGLLVTRSSLYEGPIGYIRVKRVGETLDKAVQQAWQALGATNNLNGMVLDLRYAGGVDYAAAVAVVDLFVRKEQPLLDWGQGMVRSKEKTESISVPLAVLVNRQTSGAAEALAAMLREAGAGLILGSSTAGQAMIAKEYPLKDGEHLRIATTPIQLGDGSTVGNQGLKPDIAINVSADDERVYYADAFKEPNRSSTLSGTNLTSTTVAQGTNRVRRPRLNEAELVRERREGLVLDSDFSGAGGNEADKPVVRDPVLARALDFLKGLTVMRQTRS
jgi:hypothetical protein